MTRRDVEESVGDDDDGGDGNSEERDEVCAGSDAVTDTTTSVVFHHEFVELCNSQHEGMVITHGSLYLLISK